MVDPVSHEERAAFARKLKVAVVALVGVSSALVAVQADAALGGVALALVAGLVVGVPVAWFVVPTPSTPDQRRSRADAGRQEPTTDGSDGETTGRREREGRSPETRRQD